MFDIEIVLFWIRFAVSNGPRTDWFRWRRRGRWRRERTHGCYNNIMICKITENLIKIITWKLYNVILINFHCLSNHRSPVRSIKIHLQIPLLISDALVAAASLKLLHRREAGPRSRITSGLLHRQASWIFREARTFCQGLVPHLRLRERLQSRMSSRRRVGRRKRRWLILRLVDCFSFETVFRICHDSMHCWCHEFF